MGADLAAEEQFGPYLVYERLGVGGMATVHRALERGQVGFERTVALKRLLPHLAEDASFIKSFVREAKLASLLNHNNIVQIFELGRVGAEYFISMEYIDGRDIRQILRHARRVTGPPPLNVVIGLMLQLCEALDYAHTKVDEAGQPLGLVHRDVSPSNLLVTPSGHLKVIDFGIAKAQSQQLRTQTGRVKGKLAYMAPEAISGSKDLDARSDLFAAGVIAHELLTARPLFASKNEYQTLLKVQRGDIMPPSTYNPDVPPALDAVVLHALARDPDERYANAVELRDALLAVRKELNLATGMRDIASWLAYAFSLEASDPGSSSSSIALPLPTAETLLPKPAAAAREEEEAVQVAWGGGEHEEESGVIDLDEVPDVSEKHLKPEAAPGDDIPASEPSHGHPAARPSRPSGASVPLPRAATIPPRPNAHLSVPAGLTPPRVKTISIPPKSDPGIAIPETKRAGSISGAPPTRAARIASATIPPGPSVPRPTAAARSMTDLAGPNDTGRYGAITSDPVPSETLHGTEPSDTLLAAPARVVEAPPERALPSVAAPARAANGVPQTKPGVAPNRASTAPSTLERASRPLTPLPTIGSAMIERQAPRRAWPLVAGIVALGAAAAGVYVFVLRDRNAAISSADSEPLAGANVPVATGKIKFDTQPADAEIAVEGQPVHAGAPWAIALAPGVYPVRIQRAGYKAWLTSVELSAGETYSLRVVLEPLDGGANGNEATLVLDSTPSGLEAFVDGTSLGATTPIKTTIEPGTHTIVLRQNGVDVWRHNLNAQANAAYEFNPSMTAEKQRERRARERRESPAVAAATDPKPATTAPPPAPPPPATGTAPPVTGPLSGGTTLKPDAGAPVIAKSPTGPATTPGVPSIATVPPGTRTPPPQPPPVKPPAQTGPTVAKQLPPASIYVPPAPTKGPLLIPPTAVKRISGEPPTVGSSKRDEVPAVVSAKVCIDPSGAPYKVEMVTKLERITALDFSSAVKSWRYTPYKQSGVAIHACFVVSFRVK